MKKYLLLIASLLIWFSSFSQFNETIRTSRPGQAVGSFAVGHDIFQVQSGFNFYGSENKETAYKSDGILNSTVIRYGLTEAFEIGAGAEFRNESFTQNNATTQQSGLSSLEIGMRYHIYDAKGILPNVGFLFSTKLPVSSPDYKVKDVAPRFTLIASHALSKTFFLITNWGASWNGNDSSPTGNYVINVSFPFNAKVGAFVEVYGSLHQGDFKSDFDSGFAWLVTSDLQLDLFGGYASHNGLNEYFISTGVSWRSHRDSSELRK